MINTDHYPVMRIVWSDLQEGYGSEDIAIRRDIHVDEVRKHIAQFRSQGKLPAMYGRAKKARLKPKVKA